MDAGLRLRDLLERVATSELWSELARRFGVKFGQIQMAIHDGRPSKIATLNNVKINTDDEKGREGVTREGKDVRTE